MKKTLSIAALTFAISTVGAHQAMAAEATIATDINSAYVWRGLTFNDGLVIQPSLDVSKNGFALNVWGNYDVDDYDGALDEGEFSEVDLTASYSHTFGPVDASIGIIEYLFPAGGTDTTEIFISGGMDFGAGFSGALEFYYDVNAVSDLYATASVGYAYDINGKLGLEASALISYAGSDYTEFYAGGTDSGFFNYGLGLSLSYAVTDALAIGANINYSDNLDDDALPEAAVDVKTYGGVSVSYTF